MAINTVTAIPSLPAIFCDTKEYDKPSYTFQDDMLMTMRFTLVLTILTTQFASGQNLDSTNKIRLDGLYQTKADIDKEDNDTTYSYLRFYPDRKVISVTSEGTANDLKDWFNLTMDNPSVGNYKVRRQRIYFSTTSKAGTVMYKGKIKDQYHLILKSKSLINGYKRKEKYFFVSIPD